MIVNEFRHGASQKEIAQGWPTFEEFAKYISTARNYSEDQMITFVDSLPSHCQNYNPKSHNAANHWRPISVLCNACGIKYDFIVHSDNLSEELHYIWQKLGLNSSSLPTRIRANSAGGSMKGKVRNEALLSLSEATFQNLTSRFKDDFDSFDFPLPKFSDLAPFRTKLNTTSSN